MHLTLNYMQATMEICLQHQLNQQLVSTLSLPCEIEEEYFNRILIKMLLIKK